MTAKSPPLAHPLVRPLLWATVFLLAGGLAVAAWLLFVAQGRDGHAAETDSSAKLDDIPFKGARAYESLKELCAIGPRPSGSPGMEAQQKLLAAHFEKLGGQVEFQRFNVAHPLDGSQVPMANIIIHWRPASVNRILLAAHYDTLPLPMEDKQNPKGRFVGANDNASGVAVLMELAHDMPSLKTKFGVDFVLLDGEEFLFTPNGRFFSGSEHFAREYVKSKPRFHYRWGVLLDMVGDADLQIYPVRNCMEWADTRPLVEEIWATATRLGVREFVFAGRYDVTDDHIKLHDIGHIPCIDVIDFDYPPWHTQGDTPDKCSPQSLAKVGWVIKEWLRTVKP